MHRIPMCAKQRHNTLNLCTHAATLVKMAGFVFDSASMKGEACYYKWPGKDYLLRIAAHRYTGPRSKKATKVIAKITFGSECAGYPGYSTISYEKAREMVARGIGQYLLRIAELGNGSHPHH